MKVGARNCIVGTVTSIAKGKLMCLVKVEVPARSRMASVMTIESLKGLSLRNRNFLFGLPAIENIHASASQRVQCFLREDHQLRASLSGSPKTVQSASKPSFFRQLSIPGG